MKKIRKTDRPIIYGGHHNFHRFLEPYQVNDYFLSDERLWTQYREFENFRYPSNFIDLKEIWPEVERLIGMAGGCQIWQFNALLAHENYYVRHYALFAENTMRPITKFEELVSYPFSFFWVKALNAKVWLYNKLVLLTSIDHNKAQKAVEEGKVVTNLAYGARQVLFRMINCKLHIQFPFHQDGWKETEYEKVPDYFGPYKAYKSLDKIRFF